MGQKFFALQYLGHVSKLKSDLLQPFLHIKFLNPSRKIKRKLNFLNDVELW
jgi:hypothetical protein